MTTRTAFHHKGIPARRNRLTEGSEREVGMELMPRRTAAKDVALDQSSRTTVRPRVLDFSGHLSTVPCGLSRATLYFSLAYLPLSLEVGHLRPCLGRT